MDDFIRKSQERLMSPEIQGCISVIDSILGYKLSSSDKQPFLYFHNYLTNPQPDFIHAWRIDAKKEKWYHRFANGILGDVQNSLSCVLYHYDRLVEIEKTVMEGIEKFDYRKVLENTTLSPGSTLVWDFEYQAFVLSYRRCLDYLARAICSYFMNDFNSFRQLGDFLKKLNRPIVTEPLINIHIKYCSEFDFVLSDGNRKSVRDKISHYEYVPVGCINLSRRGFILAGGGENLGIDGSNQYTLLSEVLQKHITSLRFCIREIVFTYVDSIRLEQRKTQL